MRKINLLFVMILIAVLAVCLPGCGMKEQSLDGLYVVTFELGGGTMETATASTDTSIKFGYHPGTLVLDPCEMNGYKIFRNGYIFTGWYTDESCSESSKWNFDTLLSEEQLTLYAGWKKAVKLTYALYYFDENNEQKLLGEYEVTPGKTFDDWRRLAKSRIGYTPLGYFSDPECSVEWDKSFAHPGQEEDLEVPVYVNYLKGIWTFVNTFEDFEKAISNGANIQLNADIDGNGKTLALNDYGGILEGNGHTVSNFKMEKLKRNKTYSCSIFNNLLDGAKISNVTFSDVTYDLSGTQEATEIKLAALAVSCQGKGNIEVTISNVKIEGNVVTDYTGELTKTGELIYDVATNAEVVKDGNCDIQITINNNN